MIEVSVIVPAFNSAGWIEECIHSVLGQTFHDLEVIVVDDGSTDGTNQVVNRIHDSRLRLVRQENRGAAAARNVGFEFARGQFIQYLDADDVIDLDKVERQLEVLKVAGSGAVAACAWGRFGLDISETQVLEEPVWREGNPVEWIVRSLMGEGMMQPACWLVPRELIERAGLWNEALSLHDDGEYFTRVLLQADSLHFVEGPVVHYREVAGSLSRQRSRKAIESAFEVCRLRHEALIAFCDSQRVRAAIAQQYAQFVYEFCRVAPDLARRAMGCIGGLKMAVEPTMGGVWFRRLSRAVGVRTALRIRGLVS